MRRPSGPRDEQLGQNLRTRREAAGWTARELAEVADQVRLIEIAALDRDAGPTPRRHGGIEPGHESLESCYSREPFRSDTHFALEAALEGEGIERPAHLLDRLGAHHREHVHDVFLAELSQILGRRRTAAETAVVRFLRAVGFTQAERRTLGGTQDRGDIAGVPGVVIEVKNCARQELPAWVAEAELERDNDRATLGVVWHKRRGKADPADWFVTMSGNQFAALLREQQGLPAGIVWAPQWWLCTSTNGYFACVGRCSGTTSVERGSYCSTDSSWAVPVRAERRASGRASRIQWRRRMRGLSDRGRSAVSIRKTLHPEEARLCAPSATARRTRSALSDRKRYRAFS